MTKKIDDISLSVIRSFLKDGECYIIKDKLSTFIICSIYKKEGAWRFLFNGEFDVHTLGENDEDLEWKLKLGGVGNNGSFTVHIFSDLKDVCFELRQEILKSSLRSLLTPKFILDGKEYKSNLPEILKEVKGDLGKVVDFGTYIGGIGILAGVSSSSEDYYYVYITADEKVNGHSCVGGYKVLNEIPDDIVSLYEDTGRQVEILSNVFGDPLSFEVLLLSI